MYTPRDKIRITLHYLSLVLSVCIELVCVELLSVGLVCVELLDVELLRGVELFFNEPFAILGALFGRSFSVIFADELDCVVGPLSVLPRC